MARILEPNPANIALAGERLRAGDVVAFATETVYGLGADASNAAAVGKIFALKGRPADNPLIVHVPDADAASRLAAAWPDAATKLAAAFWPGPLTLVLKRDASRVPDIVTAGRPTVAVRCPAHAVARALLESFGGAIAAPSANRSGHVSPTRALHVAADFVREKELLILNGGPCEVGIESTVLDLSGDMPRVLRPGGVSLEELRSRIGDVEAPVIESQAHSPGTAASHYAPRTPCEMIDPSALALRLARCGADRVAVLCADPRRVPAPHAAIPMPRESHAYAQRMYDALRQADDAGCRRILVERPDLWPSSESAEAWRAIMDRLRRATVRKEQEKD